MTASVTSPADVVNNALARIGYKLRVGSLYEGSDAAKKALDVYAQTRDATLREFNWGFAEAIVAAAASGGALPSIWSQTYAYPADCLQVRNMYGPAYLADKNNPLPVLFTIGSDPVVGRVIWSNVAGATLVYTRRVTDMTQWEPLFVEAVCAALGRRLVLVLGDKDVAKMEADDERGELEVATKVLG